MNFKQIHSLITDVLKKIDKWSENAERLILFTGYYESKYEHIQQLGGGPAQSFWQIEPSTAVDIFNTYLRYNKSLLLKIKGCCGLLIHPDKITENEAKWLLRTNLAFAICMCRIKYLRDSQPIPDTLIGMSEYYKRVYNTELGKGSAIEFFETTEKFLKIYDLE